MRVRQSLFVSLTALPLFLLAACERDAAPRAEPAKPSIENPPPAAPVAQTAPGMCSDESKGESACGESACNGSCACEHESAGHENANNATGAVVPITEAKIGDRTRCPVSHGIFTVRENSPSLEVDGKTYFFCCAGCINRFKQHPERFI